MDMTPEGFLICRNVPINRIGEQQYFAHELQLDGDPERVVTVHRYPEDVFAPAALASFEAKDVTQGHPPENVTAENHSLYAKGHCENVRRSGNFTLADLVIKDASLVSDIRNGVVREISCGYTCQYVPDGNGYRQTNIQGNHVAVVPRGRAGSEVSIHDSAGYAGKGKNVMGRFTKAILTALGMAAQEAESPDEVPALVAAATAVLDAEPDKAGLADAGDKGADPAPTEDVMEERAPKGDDLGSKLDRVLELLASIQKEKAPESKGGLDELLEKLEGKGEEAVVIPADQAADTCASPAAKDAALAIVKAMRPVVASIEDEKTRTKVTDALLSVFRGPDVMGAIGSAAQASARKAADQAAMTSYEQHCADSAAAYAERNPHKRQEKEVF